MLVQALHDPREGIQAPGGTPRFAELSIEDECLGDQAKRAWRVPIPPCHEAERPQRVGPYLQFAAGFRDRKDLLVDRACPPLILGSDALAEPDEDRSEAMDIARLSQHGNRQLKGGNGTAVIAGVEGK